MDNIEFNEMAVHTDISEVPGLDDRNASQFLSKIVAFTEDQIMSDDFDPNAPADTQPYAPDPPRGNGLPDKCVSAITVGRNVYWCERGNRNHEGLCGGSDPWGGNAEWRFWVDK